MTLVVWARTLTAPSYVSKRESQMTENAESMQATLMPTLSVVFMQIGAGVPSPSWQGVAASTLHHRSDQRPDTSRWSDIPCESSWPS